MSGWLSLLLGVIGVLMIPAIALLVRGAVKWTRTESKLDTLIVSVEKLVKDKDKVHAEMVAQMREDRAATNSRLEYLERIWISRGLERR